MVAGDAVCNATKIKATFMNSEAFRLFWFVPLLFASLLVCGCGSYTQAPTGEFLTVLNGRSKSPDPKGLLRKDGVYSVIAINGNQDTINTVLEKYGGDFIRPMLFFENGLFLIGDFNNNQPYFRQDYASSFASSDKDLVNDNWGIYYIEGNKITGYFYKYFAGRGMSVNQRMICKFEAYIDNGEIHNWRLVPPYPKFKITREINKLNNGIVASATIPVTLRIKPLPEKALFDSTKVWINKFRK